MIMFSGKQVTKAGEMLLAADTYDDEDKFNWAMSVLSYWRSSHEQPLETALSLVEGVTKK